MTIGAETRVGFRTLFGWTQGRPCPYSDVMKRNKSDARQMIHHVVRAAAAAGPVGWIALVACAALALAGYAISTILTVVQMLR